MGSVMGRFVEGPLSLHFTFNILQVFKILKYIIKIKDFKFYLIIGVRILLNGLTYIL